MSTKVNETQAAIKTVKYRNIQKEVVNTSDDFETLTKEFHLELGENNQAVIVEDRPVDWCEIANKDVNQVGLANILELARRRGDDLSAFAFKDDEALDLGDLDPMNPQAVTDMVASQTAANAKLESIAQQLGVSVDSLVDAFVKGTFADLVASASKVEEKEGDK